MARMDRMRPGVAGVCRGNRSVGSMMPVGTTFNTLFSTFGPQLLSALWTKRSIALSKSARMRSVAMNYPNLGKRDWAARRLSEGIDGLNSVHPPEPPLLEFGQIFKFRNVGFALRTLNSSEGPSPVVQTREFVSSVGDCVLVVHPPPAPHHYRNRCSRHPRSVHSYPPGKVRVARFYPIEEQVSKGIERGSIRGMGFAAGGELLAVPVAPGQLLRVSPWCRHKQN